MVSVAINGKRFEMHAGGSILGFSSVARKSKPPHVGSYGPIARQHPPLLARRLLQVHHLLPLRADLRRGPGPIC